MQYSNDATDRSIRKRNFFLGVYGLPLAAGAAIAAAAFYLFQTGTITRSTALTAGFSYLALVPFLISLQRKKWLRMPGKDYHYIAHLPQRSDINLHEPAEYLAEYRFTRQSKFTALLTGLLLVGTSLWMIVREHSNLISVPVLVFGGFTAYQGFRSLLNSRPKLKVAATGLWTEKLGFVHWDDLHYAEVVEEKHHDSPTLLLKIWKIGTPFEAAQQPDEILPLSPLENSDGIESLINDSIRAYNSSKAS